MNEKYKHVKRGVWVFILLGIVTLGIYDLVVYCHIGKEINQIRGDKEKKSMPFLGAFFLGFITLGIVPLVYLSRVAGKIGRAQEELGIAKPRISFPIYFNWEFFGSCIIVGPFIALYKLLHGLDKVEAALNAAAPANAISAPAMTPVSTVIEERPVEEVSPVEEKKEVQPAPVAAPAPVKASPAPASSYQSSRPAPASAKPTPVKAAPVAAKPVATKPAAPASAGDPNKVYHVSQRKEVRKWQVRFAKGEKAIKLFDTQEEAIAFAKGLAMKQGSSIRVHSKAGKIRKE